MYAENFDSGCLLNLFDYFDRVRKAVFVYRRVIFVSMLLRRKRQNFPARPDIMEGTGGKSMVTVYADVLVGMNLYVTWFLLLASERLAGVRSSALRRGLAALCGGLASLLIFLPELPFPLLFFGKLLLAAGIVWIAGGYGGWRRFCKEMIFFFAANFLFAGAMIALWLAFSPPRLVIRNGAVYYHVSALTLAVSTILAYGGIRLFAFFRERRTPEKLLYRAELAVGDRRTVCTVFLDTGNRLRGAGGLPAVLCRREIFAQLFPEEVLAALEDPQKADGLPEEWKRRLTVLPCRTAAGSRTLWGIRTDGFRPERGRAAPCILIPADDLPGEEYQAISGVLEGVT